MSCDSLNHQSTEIEGERACDEALYEEAIAFYNEPRWQKVSLGLDRIKLLLHHLGNPQNAFMTVHVAGTNGKGSTCAYLESIIRSSGMKCGLFTSPYIECFEERIRVNGENIPKSALVRVTGKVRAAATQVEAELGEHPTEFELMCAAAFLHFAGAGCDAVVCEVGLGGRLDATNVVQPVLSVITPIGLDHTDILGDTVEKIAFEKAGIIKMGVPVITCPQSEGAMRVIREVSASCDSPLHVCDLSTLESGPISDDLRTRSFEFDGRRFITKMIASYQARNAALAISAAELLGEGALRSIDGETIREGVASADWSGRFEVLGHDPLFIVDGAHNAQGAQTLAETLEDTGIVLPASATLICGMLEDKDYQGVLEVMLPYARRFYAYTPSSPRALSSEKLAECARAVAEGIGAEVEIVAFERPSQAVREAIKEGPESAILAFGTLYAISDIKKAFYD